MDILYLLTGFVFALVIPIINIEFLGLKGFIYSLLIIIFAFVVLAYVILSVFKLQISKIDYLKSKTIVSWNVTEQKKKETKRTYILSLLIGLIFGVFVYFKSYNLVISILASLACAFVNLGWWIMGIKRLDSKLNETDHFLLSHVGMIYNNKIDVFNGYSKGIINAERAEKLLILTLIKNKKQSEFRIEIPEEKINEVDDFLKDLSDYFNGDNDEK